ncbi:MAG: MCP four helix bundle domain-containing protein, partial [Terracidiphilus sp.]
MQWLRNLPISRKFIAAFGIVCGLCIVLGVYSFITFRGIAIKSKDVSDNALPSLIALANISTATHNARREDLDLLLCQTAACTSMHNESRLKAIADYK